MPESDEFALCMQVDKPISEEGYRDNFIPRITEMVDKNGEIRLLVYFKKYDGWEQEAVGFDLESTLNFGKYVKRFALVNTPEKMMFAYKLKQPMINGEIKFFGEDELPKALVWVKE